MSENENGKESVSGWVDPNIAASVRREAKDRAVSVSTIVHWALRDRYRHQSGQNEIHTALTRLRTVLYDALNRCYCKTASCPKCEANKIEFTDAVADLLNATVDESYVRFAMMLDSVE